MSGNTPRRGIALITIDPGDDLAGLRAWYESVRLPTTLAVPGVTGVTRWEVVSRYGRTPGGGGHVELPAPPAYVVIYELDDVAVARSEAFLDAAGRDFTQVAVIDGTEVEFSQVINVTLGFVMEQANPEAATTQTRAIMAVSISPRREWIPMLHEWYDDVHVPELMSCPGFLRTRRFESLDGIKNFFALYELDDSAALFSEEFKHFSGRKVDELPAIQQQLQPNMTGNICDIYRRLD